MFFILFSFTISFDLREPFKTAWNVELFDPTMSGEVASTFFYNFNLTSQDSPDDFSAIVYEGNFSDLENNTDEKNPIASFEIKMNDGQEGSIEINEVKIADFKFVESFPYFLAAYGTYNQSFTYAANIVNLATIHISLFSFEKKLFREIVLTRYQPTHESIPWYIKYNSIVVGGGVFVLTLVFLHFSDHIKKFLGFKKDTNEEKNENAKSQSKEKEIKGKKKLN